MKKIKTKETKKFKLYLEPIGEGANEKIGWALHDTGEFVEVNTHIKRDNAGIPHPVWECPYRLARMLKNSPSLKGKIKIWIASGKKQITDGEFIFNKSKKSKSIKSVN